MAPRSIVDHFVLWLGLTVPCCRCMFCISQWTGVTHCPPSWRRGCAEGGWSDGMGAWGAADGSDAVVRPCHIGLAEPASDSWDNGSAETCIVTAPRIGSHLSLSLPLPVVRFGSPGVFLLGTHPRTKRGSHPWSG
jgi:hypothetical protein